jgi:hypothetical protein
MRITDCRYDRDRLKLAVAYRLIWHEARTHTIRQCTGLSGDFRRSVEHELQAATLATLLSGFGLLASGLRLPGPRIEDVAKFCDVYETFLAICPGSVITFEHAWYLGQTLSQQDEFVLTRCPDCRAAWIRDTLDLLPYNCAACRRRDAPPPGA